MNKTPKRAASGLPPLRIGLLMSESEKERIIRERLDEQYARMQALADSLAIPDDPFRWYSVALHLAQQHVPELKEIKRVGRTKKWGEMELGALAVEIERITSAGVTIEKAAKQLAAVEPWKSFLEEQARTNAVSPDPAAALTRAYTKAKQSPLTRVVRNAFGYHEMQGTVGEWERDYVLTIGTAPWSGWSGPSTSSR